MQHKRQKLFSCVGCTVAQAGPALGLIDDFEYQTAADPLAHGDRILLFTDGLTEASGQEEEFGEQRLRRSLAQTSPLSIENALEQVLRDVKEFAGSGFADDICLVGIEFVQGGT